ncbi:MAG: hypothetical protein ACLP59_08070 [Bryobacteraceae bacterium]
MKQICRYLPILSLLLVCVPFASAQSSVDFMIGFGTAHDSANAGGIDSAVSANAYGSCTPNTGDPYCQSLPALSGFFLGFGGDVMLWKHFGLGATAIVQPARSNYGPLLSRQAFYDVNGVYRPVSSKRVSLDLIGGIGGAHTGFGINESGCVGTAVCSNSVYPVGSSNHFDIHAGVGVSLFVTDHIFIRPEFDVHYAPGLNNQFNSNLVPAGMVWVGYSFGDR